MMLVTREFIFPARHFLPDYYGHPERPHEHTYKLCVTVSGEVQKNGLLLDFALLKWIVKKAVLERLADKNLNDVFPIPSAEKIAEYVWDMLEPLQKHIKYAFADPAFHEKIMKHTARGSAADSFRHVFSGSSCSCGFQLQHNEAVQLHEIVVFEDDDTRVTYRKRL